MKTHAPGFQRLVEERRAHIPEVSPAEAAARLAQPGAAVHLIDVREDNEWQAGHARGARHIGKGILERDIEGLIADPEAEIILYCAGGFRSILAADALQQLGYRRVSSMAGGFRAWAGAGLPVETP